MMVIMAGVRGDFGMPMVGSDYFPVFEKI